MTFARAAAFIFLAAAALAAEPTAPSRVLRLAPGDGAIAVSDDGKMLAVLTNSELQLWSLPSSAFVAAAPVKGGGDSSVSFAPGGRKLAVHGDESAIYELVNGSLLKRQAFARPLSPDWRYSARGENNAIYAGLSERRLIELGNCYFVAFNGRSSAVLLTCKEDMTPEQKKRFDEYEESIRNTSHPMGDPETLAKLTETPTDLVVRSLPDGKELGRVRSPFWATDGGALSNDGRFVVVGGRNRDKPTDAKALLIKLADGSQVSLYNWARQSLFSPDDRSIVEPGGSGGVVVFDQAGRYRVLKDTTVDNDIENLALSADGAVYAEGHDGIQVFRLSDGAARPPVGPVGTLSGLIVSPDRRRAAAAYGSAVRLIDLATGRTLRDFATRKADVLAFSPDGRRLAAHEMYSNSVDVWDVGSGERQAALDAGVAKSLSFTPDGGRLFIGYSVDAPTLWELDTKEKIKALDVGATDSAVLLPDGQHVLAMMFNSEQLALIKLETGVKSRDFDGLGTVAVSFALSPDWKRLAADGGTIGGGNKLALWDFDTAEVIRSIVPPASGPLAFSPDGSRLYLLSLAPKAFDARTLADIPLPDLPNGQHWAIVDGGTLLSDADWQGRSLAIWRVGPATAAARRPRKKS